MQQDTPNVGSLAGEDARRDAIHVAVAPVVAAGPLDPGDHVWLDDHGEATKGDGRRSASTIGVVDPFLDSVVLKGERFWVCLYPGTVTSLRHVWSHPAFTAKVPRRVGPTAPAGYTEDRDVLLKRPVGDNEL